ncbi:MAG: metallophosphoesterase [Saprospirales bacterium]|nr:metallophosphoesterase [Saprospirales bacterium]
MKLLPAALLCLPLAAASQSPVDSSFTDGPYIFFDSNQVVAKWVSGGTLFTDTLSPGESLQLDPGVSHSFDPSCVDLEDPFVAHPRISFKGVKKLAAISDIHGQYILMLKLLRAHGVIDAEGNWAFGEGHLVVLGDVFDRGDEVVDILWLIHKLEKQAEDANGRVHYLLGNHEVMNLKNDLRYVNKKYRTTTSLTRIPYNVLFGPETYFGRWIRSKPVSVTINDMVFVHGGLSETCLNLGLSLEQMNTAFQKQILDMPEEEILADPALKILYSEVGPIWYRGYFEEGFTKKRARDILRFLGKKHIVIGHTPAPQVRGLYGSKIFAIDSSIQLGEDGELFWYEEGKFFRGSLSGEKIKLQ